MAPLSELNESSHGFYLFRSRFHRHHHHTFRRRFMLLYRRPDYFVFLAEPMQPQPSFAFFSCRAGGARRCAIHECANSGAIANISPPFRISFRIFADVSFEEKQQTIYCSKTAYFFFPLFFLFFNYSMYVALLFSCSYV